MFENPPISASVSSINSIVQPIFDIYFWYDLNKSPTNIFASSPPAAPCSSIIASLSSFSSLTIIKTSSLFSIFIISFLYSIIIDFNSVIISLEVSSSIILFASSISNLSSFHLLNNSTFFSNFFINLLIEVTFLRSEWMSEPKRASWFLSYWSLISSNVSKIFWFIIK